MTDLIHGDCLVEMNSIPDKSTDMILCDLPYGTTACRWDVIIPFEPLWAQYNRIIKDRGAIVLFGSEPFSSYLRMSNIKQYKYDWVWNKKLAGNGILAKVQPLKIHELIHVINSGVYYPQKTKGILRSKMTSGIKICELNNGDGIKCVDEYKNDTYYPVSIQEYGIGNMRIGRLHPTQKPVALLEYLIRTYTLEGETVLDNCMGSGSTGIACMNTNRNFIGIEKDDKYFEIAKKRIEEHLTNASTGQTASAS
jgi:DNA modification methylase